MAEAEPATLLHLLDEGLPGAGGEGQQRAVGVLAIADRHGRPGGSNLNAGSAVTAAIAAGPPGDGGHVHCSSATFLIRSRDAARDSASARSLSNERAT